MDTAKAAIRDLETAEKAKLMAAGEQPSPERHLSDHLFRLAWHTTLVQRITQLIRIAVCGPACTVVWQGRAGDRSPYADLLRGAECAAAPRLGSIGL